MTSKLTKFVPYKFSCMFYGENKTPNNRVILNEKRDTFILKYFSMMWTVCKKETVKLMDRFNKQKQ